MRKFTTLAAVAALAITPRTALSAANPMVGGAAR